LRFHGSFTWWTAFGFKDSRAPRIKSQIVPNVLGTSSTFTELQTAIGSSGEPSKTNCSAGVGEFLVAAVEAIVEEFPGGAVAARSSRVRQHSCRPRYEFVSSRHELGSKS
jgi:hypothetical protein